MKKQLLVAALASVAATGVNAQTTITDTAKTGASYANNVYYSLANGTVATVAKNNWDLAFQAFGGYTASVLINNYAGTNQGAKLWKFPTAEAADFGTALDTAGLSTWTPYTNSEVAWENGAFESAINLGAFDMGWGNYNMGTHTVIGDSIYIVKTNAGAYKQLIIDSLISSVYTFRYANLDGTDVQTATINKADYATKNFAFYSLDNNAALDREPATASWDILFGQYQTLSYPGAEGTQQGVTGALINRNVKVAKVQKTAADAPAFETFAGESFDSTISIISHDWKFLNYTTMVWEINDSLVHFVEVQNGDIYKLVFTGFGGSGTGNFIFNKKKIYTAPPASVANVEANNVKVVVSPNPANAGAQANIVYSFSKNENNAQLSVVDLNGRIVSTAVLNNNAGLHVYALNTGNLQAGVYFVTVTTASVKTVQKLVIQ